MSTKKPTKKQRQEAFLDHRIAETIEHLQCNGSPDADYEDAYEDLMSECGQMRDGSCLNAGREYCDFECPFNS